jgi:hypothetical protein
MLDMPYLISVEHLAIPGSVLVGDICYSVFLMAEGFVVPNI